MVIKFPLIYINYRNITTYNQICKIFGFYIYTNIKAEIDRYSYIRVKIE